MAEAEPHVAEGEGGGDSPLAHIQDSVLFGLGTDGQLRYRPVKHGLAVAGYAPKQIGPFKLEFTKHMMNVTVVAVFLAAAVLLVARRIIARVRTDQAPHGPLDNAVEAVLMFVRDDLVIPSGGHHVARYTPLFVTYFLFILLNNLSGMIPAFGGGTSNIGVTAAMGGSVLMVLTVLGLAHQGPVNYFLHMVPPGTPLPMWPLMFVLEFFGPIIKCFVLCVRLFANMIAGHLVLSSILTLGVFKAGATGMAVMGLAVGLPLALGVSVLEILVCLIQAYVFTMLSVIFVGAAVHPSH